MNTTQTKAPEKNATWRIAKIIRVSTVPPIAALAAFSVFLATDGFYESIWEYIAAVAFITLLPVTAYPLQLIIPPFKHQGREGQRNLAFVMCTLGYILGVVYGLIFSVGAPIFTMFLTYLLSGTTLLAVNKLFRFKASGHSCGLLGPLAALAYFVGPLTLTVSIPLFLLSLWSSVYMKRHTVAQFIVGGLIPVIWLIVCVLVIL
ncbi:MAG: hypothetical protein E7647_01270 [Ruminococcaceae bacterium]|nr:hypothetical protein [Oscillospiraceae bacterium]